MYKNMFENNYVNVLKWYIVIVITATTIVIGA